MSESKLPLREAIARRLHELQCDRAHCDEHCRDDFEYEAADEILAMVALEKAPAISNSAVQSEGSPSPLGSTLDEARAHRRQNPEYVEAENRIAALARKLAETHGCSETDTDEDVDEFFQQHRDEYEGLAVTALSWLAEQALQPTPLRITLPDDTIITYHEGDKPNLGVLTVFDENDREVEIVLSDSLAEALWHTVTPENAP